MYLLWSSLECHLFLENTMPRTQLSIGTHGNISKFPHVWIPPMVNDMPRDRVRPDANPVDPNQPLSDLDQNGSESVDTLDSVCIYIWGMGNTAVSCFF